jgi:hypothetical protein
MNSDHILNAKFKDNELKESSRRWYEQDVTGKNRVALFS